MPGILKTVSSEGDGKEEKEKEGMAEQDLKGHGNGVGEETGEGKGQVKEEGGSVGSSSSPEAGKLLSGRLQLSCWSV